MRKLLLALLCAFMTSTNLTAGTLVPLTVSWGHDMPIGHGGAKSPMQSPTVYIEDFTLSFAADHPDYILNIKDEDGDVVYTTTVYSAMTQAVLPSTLTGDYEIELVMGNWLFTGCINL